MLHSDVCWHFPISVPRHVEQDDDIDDEDDTGMSNEGHHTNKNSTGNV